MDLKELESGVDPNTHWYYQSKKWPMLRFIKKVYREINQPLTLVDIGSGSGFFMYAAEQELFSCIEKIWLVDIGYTDEEIAATTDQRIEKRRDLPSKMEHTVVVMMDVLEHLEDDYAMLSAIKERLVGTNYFFITVPAFLDLWSGHDVYLGHYRRYTRKTLNALLDKINKSSRMVYYLYGAIFPLVWITRKIGNKTYKPKTNLAPIAAPINFLLKKYNTMEMSISKSNKLFGVTCAAEGKW